MKLIGLLIAFCLAVTPVLGFFKNRRNLKRISRCLAKCPDYLLPQGICSSNGKIYTDECRAKCFNPAYESLFTCKTPFDDVEKLRCTNLCENAAKTQPSFLSCSKKCPFATGKDRKCASDGQVYNSLCQMNCKNRMLYEVFSCENMSKAECKAKCTIKQNLDTCESNCPTYIALNKICASDAQLYVDICRAKCKNNSLWEIMNCDTMSDFQCQAECQNKVKNSQCLSQCVVYPDGMPAFCSKNGKVYDDMCRAKCMDSSVEFAWSCKQRGFLRSNNFFCINSCSKYATCRAQCVGSSYEAINGPDGVIYQSKCEAQCHGVSLFPRVPYPVPVPVVVHRPLVQPVFIPKPKIIRPYVFRPRRFP